MEIQQYDRERVEFHADGTATYRMLFPVKRGDGEVAEVTLRRPRVADVQAVDNVKGEFSKQIRMLAQVSGVEDPILKRFDLVDFYACDQIIRDLMGKSSSPATSTTL